MFKRSNVIVAAAMAVGSLLGYTAANFAVNRNADAAATGEAGGGQIGRRIASRSNIPIRANKVATAISRRDQTTTSRTRLRGACGCPTLGNQSTQTNRE